MVFSAILVEAVGPEALGATGNGPIWIFKGVRDHAVLLLDGFHLMFAVNHVFRHSNGFDELYEFDGMRYQPGYCYQST
jgi:hypothetical protein